MPRWIAAVAVLGGALVLPQSGHAQSTMCAEPVFAAILERDEAPPLPPLGEDELPWCASSEDPRCAPIHSHGGSQPVGMRPALAVDSEGLPDRPALGDEQTFTPAARLHPRAGRYDRVERPPRRERRSP